MGLHPYFVDYTEVEGGKWTHHSQHDDEAVAVAEMGALVQAGKVSARVWRELYWSARVNGHLHFDAAPWAHTLGELPRASPPVAVRAALPTVPPNRVRRETDIPGSAYWHIDPRERTIAVVVFAEVMALGILALVATLLGWGVG